MVASIIQKQSVTHDVYENFYSILSSIDGPNSPFTTRIFPSMPDVELHMLSSYPIMILESPEIDLQQFTLGKNVSEGTINFTIYSSSAKNRDELLDKAKFALETNKGTLARNGIKQVFLGKSRMDQVARGKIKVNFVTIPIEFKVYTEKTGAT